MTTYRMFDGQSGRPGVGSTGTQPPATVTSASGGWLLGTAFTTTGQVLWLNGYYTWVPGNGDMTAQKFALWEVYASGGSSQVLVANSVVTSGTLTQGAYNYVPLATPIQLAPGDMYVAATGWTVTTGIPLTSNQFGTGGPYTGGVTNGPVTAWPAIGSGGVSPFAWATNFGIENGLFSNVLGADPSVSMPNNNSGSDLFWVDVQVSTTPPAGYQGSYRLRPNTFFCGACSNTGNDTANNFTLGLEFSLSQKVTVNNVWFYSPATLTQLPTSVGVFNAAETLVVSNNSPSWSGVAGSGWVKTAAGWTLPAGSNYKLGVCNGAGTPAIWNDYVTDYWNAGGGATGGFGGGGLTAGPLTFPDNSQATSPGQATYNGGATLTYPATHAGPYDYLLDIEVTPSGGGGAGPVKTPSRIPALIAAGAV